MKPNFALSLSFEGIRLLHRAAGGWRVLGDVALDVDDLATELAVLRKTAATLEPGGVRTKLLIPNSQIKYLTIDTEGRTGDALNAAARAALDGATPYAVDDLVYDISPEGSRTHIAAVAYETLTEAEAFAEEHRFHPVSFAAIPGEEAYLGEPYFGTTNAAANLLEPDEEVEPDGIAVVVIGDVTAPSGPVADAPEPDPIEEDAPETPVCSAGLDQSAASDAEVEADPTEPETPEKAEPANVKSALSKAAGGDPDDAPAEAPQPSDPAPSEPPSEAPQPSDPTPAPPASPPPRPDEVPPAQTATGFADAAGSSPKAPPPEVGFASRRAADSKPKPPQLGGALRGGSLPTGAESVSAPRIAPAPDMAADVAIAPDSSSLTIKPENSPQDDTPKAGFLTRRKHHRSPTTAVGAVAVATSGVITPAPTSEADRMTIFGARKGADVGGKPRFLGLILTAALLVFLAGVAAWASVFIDDGITLSRIFGDRSARAAASDPAQVVTPDVIAMPEPVVEPETLRTAALDPDLSDEDGAVLDALRAPLLPDPEPPTEQELQAKYASTGIWPRAPIVPEPPAMVSLDDLYVTSIDPVSTSSDAIALPEVDVFASDLVLASVPSPAAAGTDFALDARGLVVPTAAGALNPDGVLVYLGRPAVVPPATPTRFATTPEVDTERAQLVGLRPRARPGDLAETTERAQLDGLTRSELADLRPKLRPQSLQQQAEDPPAPTQSPDISADDAVAAALASPPAIQNATKYAVQTSVRPDTRPSNFARIVKRAERRAPAPTQVASAASVSPRTVAPSVPSKTSVAKQATVKNAIRLNQVNLIGVYGKPSNRRALVRLGNGRYQKVVVGDRIDGGRVSAIGDSELRYSKRGRDVVLRMPSG